VKRYSERGGRQAGTAPALIGHGDADPVVPMVEGETTHAALTKVGVPASFVRIEGAEHDFSGADLERAAAAMMQWF
jgi:acetyl esterase/lipase